MARLTIVGLVLAMLYAGFVISFRTAANSPSPLAGAIIAGAVFVVLGVLLDKIDD